MTCAIGFTSELSSNLEFSHDQSITSIELCLWSCMLKLKEGQFEKKNEYCPMCITVALFVRFNFTDGKINILFCGQ